MFILLHSSKTMLSNPSPTPLRKPQLLKKATELATYLKTLTTSELAKSMHVSPALAEKTKTLLKSWTASPESQTPALDSFIGDIYSGLQVESFTESDRKHADKILGILSGLYGLIRPLDGIHPYRLEMGYKLPNYPSLYDFWSQNIANLLPKTGPIINLASEEFSKTITPYIDQSRIISPKFLTLNPKTNKPSFVAIHAKITRGAFAHWLITTRTESPTNLKNFTALNYQFSPTLSTPQEPVFITPTFTGKGLSIKKKAKK